jgi:hypothetical protein
VARHHLAILQAKQFHVSPQKLNAYGRQGYLLKATTTPAKELAQTFGKNGGLCIYEENIFFK